jgi:hypothetical protein
MFWPNIIIIRCLKSHCFKETAVSVIVVVTTIIHLSSLCACLGSYPFLLCHTQQHQQSRNWQLPEQAHGDDKWMIVVTIITTAEAVVSLKQ